MEKVIEFIKKNKIKIIIAIVILIIVIFGVCFYIDYNKKEYKVEEITSYNYYILKTDDGKTGVIDKFR